MSKLLVETSSKLVESAEEGVWKAVLCTPGQGSSANYSESALRESGPRAFKAGAHSYITHNRTENGEPNPEKLWAVLTEDATYEDGVGLVGKLKVMPHWREFVEAVAPHTALSIYAMGDTDSDGNLVEFAESIDNGIDMVSYPGRSGSGLVQKMYEAAIASAPKAGNGAPTGDGRSPHSKEQAMEIDELARKVDALAESVNAFITEATPLLETLKPSDDSGEVDIEAVVETVVEAQLPKASRKVVLESVKRGENVADAIKTQKEFVEAIRKDLTESAPRGYVNESASDSTDFTIGAWN